MPTDGMDSGEYVSTVDNMDPTLAELGDEFTLGDIDGKLIKALLLVLFVFCLCRSVSAKCDSSAGCLPAEQKRPRGPSLIYVKAARAGVCCSIILNKIKFKKNV